MEAQRRRIMRAALRCIAKRGVEETTIARIASEARLTSGAIYSHFASKNDLIQSTLSFLGAELPAEPPATWDAFKRRLLTVHDPLEVSQPTVLRALLHLRTEFLNRGQTTKALKEIVEQEMAFRSRCIEALVASEHVRLIASLDETVRHISALIEGLVWLEVQTGQDFDRVTADFHKWADQAVEVLSPAPNRSVENYRT